MQIEVTEDELQWITEHRAVVTAGCPMHRCGPPPWNDRDDRLYYFWPMGEQNQSLAAPTIELALKAHTAVYEPPQPGTKYSQYSSPRKRCGCDNGPCWHTIIALQEAGIDFHEMRLRV